MGQPDMQRENTGLGSETDEGQHEHHDLGDLGQGGGGIESEGAAVGIDHAESGQDEQGPGL